MKWLKENSIAVLVGLTFVLGLLLIYIASTGNVGDFINYYYGGWFLNHGQFDKFVYEPYLFNLEIRKHYSGFFFGNFTPVPPITAWLFTPFACLPIGLAKALFNLLSLGLFCYSLLSLLKHLQLKTVWLVLLPLVFLLPLKSNMAQGQLYLLLLALLMQGFLFTEQKRKRPAAFCFGVAIALKIFPAVVLLYLLLNRNYHVLLRTIAIVVALIFGPYVVTHNAFTLDYYTQILPRLMSGEINDPWATAYQSMTVLLRQLFVYDPLLNAGTTLFEISLFKALNTLFTLLFSLAFARIVYKAIDRWQQFALTLFLGVLVSGYGSVYGLLLLVPLLIAFIGQKYGYVVLALLAGVVFSPLLPAGGYPLFKFARLWVMLLLAIWVIVQYDKKLLALPVLFVITSALVYSSQKNNLAKQRLFDNVLDRQDNLLLFNYEQVADSLKLSYITPTGITEECITFTDTLVADSRLELIDNEVYFNRHRLTYNGGRKLKPLLNAANNEILYLSDAGRGVGFYTLKRVSIKQQ